MNEDIEKIPTDNLEKALERREIRGVIFDLDNTVFSTDSYYITTLFRSGNKELIWK